MLALGAGVIGSVTVDAVGDVAAVALSQVGGEGEPSHALLADPVELADLAVADVARDAGASGRGQEPVVAGAAEVFGGAGMALEHRAQDAGGSVGGRVVGGGAGSADVVGVALNAVGHLALVAVPVEGSEARNATGAIVGVAAASTVRCVAEDAGLTSTKNTVPRSTRTAHPGSRAVGAVVDVAVHAKGSV